MKQWYDNQSPRLQGSLKIGIKITVGILYFFLVLVVMNFLWDIHWMLGLPFAVIFIMSLVTGIVYVVSCDDDFLSREQPRPRRRY